MALDALMVVSNPGRARRKRFSPAQKRAQALFVKRVKSGASRRKNTKLAKGTKLPWPKWGGDTGRRYSKGSGTSGKFSARSLRAHSDRLAPFMKRSARRPSKYRRNTKLTASSFAQGGGMGKITSKIKRKYHAAKIGWKKNPKRSTMAFRRRNRFAKGKKSTKARRIAKKFWRSTLGRKFKAARRSGHSMKAAWRLARGGKTRRKARRSSGGKIKRKSAKRRRAARLAWAVRKHGPAGGYFTGMRRPNRRRRNGRRRKASVSRRRSRRVIRRRRGHTARRTRRSRRRNPGMFSFLSPRRRRSRRSSRRGRHSRRSRRSGRFTGRRTNPGLWLLKPAAFGLGGLAATRLIPRLVGGFFPSIGNALGGAGGLLLSVAALFAIGFATRKVRFLSGQATPIMVGAGIGVLSEVIQRFAPPEWVAAIGLTPSAPMMLGPSSDDAAVSGYVPEGMGAYVPEALGAYVRDRGLGLEVSEALGGYTGDCVGCTHPREATGAIGALSGGIFTGDTYSRSIF